MLNFLNKNKTQNFSYEFKSESKNEKTKQLKSIHLLMKEELDSLLYLINITNIKCNVKYKSIFHQNMLTVRYEMDDNELKSTFDLFTVKCQTDINWLKTVEKWKVLALSTKGINFFEEK